MATPPEATELRPENPDFERVARERFARQGFMGAIGAWLVEVAPGRAVVEVPYSARLAHEPGLFHGAIVGAVGDSAGGIAALTLLAAGADAVTAECKINFVRPAEGELLRAEGQVLNVGRRLVIARIDVMCVADGKSTVCGLLQSTYVRT